MTDYESLRTDGGITAIANTLACKLTQEEISLLGAIFTRLGDTLTTIATHNSICCGK